MINLDEAEYEVYIDDFIKELSKRKNLMVYEGIKDGLEECVKSKYCYSSPYDPLEFVIIDIYNKPVMKNICNKKVEVFGIMSIIRDEDRYIHGDFDTIYGAMEICKLCIRDVKKNEIILNINKNGIQHLKNVVLYFEDYFCRKMHC